MARSSAYGNYLNRLGGINSKLPDWVLGSDFGELQSQLAKADSDQWLADTRRSQMIANEMAVNDAQDQARYEDILTGELRNRQPATLRDAYQIALETAQDAGSSDEIIKLTEKVDKMNREEQLGKFSDILSAAQLGRIDPALADEYLQTLGRDYKFRPGTFKRSVGKAPRLSPFYNEANSDWEWVDPTDYARQEQLLQSGYTPGLTKKNQGSDIFELLKALRGDSIEDPVSKQKSVSQDVLEQYGGGKPRPTEKILPGPDGKPIRVIGK
jgi:hypothetical protein